VNCTKTNEAIKNSDLLCCFFINFCILSSKYKNNYKFNEKYDFGFYCFRNFSSEDRNTVKNGKIVRV